MKQQVNDITEVLRGLSAQIESMQKTIDSPHRRRAAIDINARTATMTPIEIPRMPLDGAHILTPAEMNAIHFETGLHSSAPKPRPPK